MSDILYYLTGDWDNVWPLDWPTVSNPGDAGERE